MDDLAFELRERAARLLDTLAVYLHADSEARNELLRQGIGVGAVNSLYPLNDLASWSAGCARISRYSEPILRELRAAVPTYMAVDWLSRCLVAEDAGVKELTQHIANRSALNFQSQSQWGVEQSLMLAVELLAVLTTIQSVPESGLHITRPRSLAFFEEVEAFVASLELLPRHRARVALEEMSRHLKISTSQEKAEALAAGVPAAKANLLYPFELEAYLNPVRAILQQQGERVHYGSIFATTQFETSLKFLPASAYAEADGVVYYDEFFDGGSELASLVIDIPSEYSASTNAALVKNQWGYLILFLHFASTTPEPLATPDTNAGDFFYKWLESAEKASEGLAARLRALPLPRLPR